MLGQLLDGRYELLRPVASGGMGTVYEALHTGTGKRVAVKLVTGWDGDETETVVRFQREAMAAGSIETPHIVRVLDAGRDRSSGVPFLVMEFLIGFDLDHVLAQLGSLPVDVALRIAAQACMGLEKAHRAGIVHRDIKPANLFVSRQDEGRLVVKLLDFGIAKLPRNLLSSLGRSNATTTGKLLGSPLYMSPEQAKGLRTLDHRTDVWSLGAVLYTMLAGIAPFGKYETVGQIIVAICSEKVRPLTEVAPSVPAPVARLVERALSVAVDQRPPSAAALLAELHELLPHGADIREEELPVSPKALVDSALVDSPDRLQFLSGETTLSGAFSEQLSEENPGLEDGTHATSAPAPNGAGGTLRSGPAPGEVRRGLPRRWGVWALALAGCTLFAIVAWLAPKEDSGAPKARDESAVVPATPNDDSRPNHAAIERRAAAVPSAPVIRAAHDTPAIPMSAPPPAVKRAKVTVSRGERPSWALTPSPRTSPNSAPAPSSAAPAEAQPGASSFSTLDKNFE